MNNINTENAFQQFYKPLKLRFYILITFCIFNFVSGMLWNAWPPIMISIEKLYGWSTAEVSLQSNLASIIFCLFVLPFIYLWNKTGIRFLYFMSAMSLVVGTFIRLYPSSLSLQSILIQVGSVVTAFGGIFPTVAPTFISMLWFPSHERARATAAAISFNSLGSALSPILASQIVPEMKHNSTDGIEAGIKKYTFLHCTISIIVTGMIIAYFPSRPSILPCKSSDISLRLEFWSGCKELMKNSQFWIVFFATMIGYGFNSALSVVAISYTIPMGITQTEFGVLSSTANIFTFISVFLGGWLGDKFSYKSIVYASVPPSVIMYGFSGLQCLKLMPHTLVSLYIVNSIQNLTTNFACPVFFEMGCEIAFPVREEVVTALLSLSGNLGIFIFVSLCMIGPLGTTWIPFAYGFSCLLMVPLMWLYKDERNRRRCDEIVSQGDVLEIGIDNDAASVSDRIVFLN